MHFYIMSTATAYPRMYLYQRLVQAKLFIDAHYAEAIDLDNISDEACFSKFHFIRSFARVFGKTPYQYLTSIRVEKARQLLKENSSIADACFSVGFESISSFTTLFKKYTGYTPAAWQVMELQKITHCRTMPFEYIPGCYAAQHGWKENSNFEEEQL